MNFDDVEIATGQRGRDVKILINGVEPKGVCGLKLEAEVGSIVTLTLKVYPRRVHVNGRAIVAGACSCPVKDLLSIGHSPDCPDAKP